MVGHDGKMSTCPTLETERLTMRAFSQDDLDAYFDLFSTPEVRSALAIPASFDREQAWAQMAFFLGQWELRGTGLWALEEKATGRLVGRAGLYQPERADWPGLEVGWALHPEVWGLGYATEAGARSVQYGFSEAGAERLFSCILPENVRSQAVAKRLGFSLLEERVLSHFPQMPHGIWFLDT